MRTTQLEQRARYTDELRRAAGDQWERVVHHRFTKQLAAGSIDPAVLRRYLIQDHRFLDSFTVLLASIIACLPTLEDRIPACQFLAIITGPENTYFERCFEKLNISAKERVETSDAICTTEFCQLMRDVARQGTLVEMLAVTVVCEWSYLSWGRAVLDEGIVIRDDFVAYEWVDLHSGEAFERVVEYLRSLLDREATRLRCQGRQDELEGCQIRFLEAVQLEEAFFEYACSGNDDRSQR